MNENEILFENTYTDTPETFEELYLHLFARNRKIYAWVFGGMAVLTLAAVLVVDVVYVLPFLMSLFFLFYYRRIYRRMARQRMQQTVAFYDGVMPVQTLRFTDDTIYYHAGYASFRLPIEKLTQVTMTKNGMIFQAGSYFQTFLVRNAFTRGTYEDFLLFLRAKRPDLKIPL